MATSKGKRGIKKSATMKKGKALQPVKPLTENISLSFGNPKITYKSQ
jgi:hypothetical protein